MTLSMIFSFIIFFYVIRFNKTQTHFHWKILSQNSPTKIFFSYWSIHCENIKPESPISDNVGARLMIYWSWDYSSFECWINGLCTGSGKNRNANSIYTKFTIENVRAHGVIPFTDFLHIFFLFIYQRIFFLSRLLILIGKAYDSHPELMCVCVCLCTHNSLRKISIENEWSNFACVRVWFIPLCVCSMPKWKKQHILCYLHEKSYPMRDVIKQKINNFSILLYDNLADLLISNLKEFQPGNLLWWWKCLIKMP